MLPGRLEACDEVIQYAVVSKVLLGCRLENEHKKELTRYKHEHQPHVPEVETHLEERMPCSLHIGATEKH